LRSGQSRPKAGCERKGIIYGQALSDQSGLTFLEGERHPAGYRSSPADDWAISAAARDASSRFGLQLSIRTPPATRLAAALFRINAPEGAHKQRRGNTSDLTAGKIF